MPFLIGEDPQKAMEVLFSRGVDEACQTLGVPLAVNERKWVARLLGRDLLHRELDVELEEVLGKVTEAMKINRPEEKGRLLAIAGRTALLLGAGVGAKGGPVRDGTRIAENVFAHSAAADPTIDLEYALDEEAISPEQRHWAVTRAKLGLVTPWLVQVSNKVEPISAVLEEAGGQLFYGSRKRYN